MKKLTVLKFLRRFERPPILEPKHWWHKIPLRRKNTYRRLALETLGANNLISDHTIVRAHDRANPMMIKMFTSSNYGKRDFKATDSKATCEDWDAPGRILEVQEALENYTAVWFTMWNMDPTPHVIRRVLMFHNWGSQTGEDEKGRVR